MAPVHVGETLETNNLRQEGLTRFMRIPVYSAGWGYSTSINNGLDGSLQQTIKQYYKPDHNAVQVPIVLYTQWNDGTGDTMLLEWCHVRNLLKKVNPFSMQIQMYPTQTTMLQNKTAWKYKRWLI